MEHVKFPIEMASLDRIRELVAKQISPIPSDKVLRGLLARNHVRRFKPSEGAARGGPILYSVDDVERLLPTLVKGTR